MGALVFDIFSHIVDKVFFKCLMLAIERAG